MIIIIVPAVGTGYVFICINLLEVDIIILYAHPKPHILIPVSQFVFSYLGVFALSTRSTFALCKLRTLCVFNKTV